MALVSAIPDSRKSGTSNLGRLMRLYPEVQLATLVDGPPAGDDWVHEIKYDGYRLLGFVSGGEVRLRTRNGKDWTEKFPSIVSALERLKAQDAVLDMEAVVVDAAGKSSFQSLQAALGEGGHAEKIVAFILDILHLDGADLTRATLVDRKEKLKELLAKAPASTALRYSDHVEGHGDLLFAKACSHGLEGIVSKQAGATYVAGRQKSWLKSKCEQRQEFVSLVSVMREPGIERWGRCIWGIGKKALCAMREK